eukprot:TRINITY_DN4475_c0_g1_i8.p1 TRINITY_DN4475_c0_g1~~TRINITY_DN4475_c0_g1_i8.p1  ORF type:complete len:165 (-),score=36.49 TRINITY_DN4475_c0_g1_i8:204-698(-)
MNTFVVAVSMVTMAVFSNAAPGHHHMGTTGASMMDIVEIASGDPRFSTLVTAVVAADLVDTLKGAGPFTVFAPTNDGFANIPEDDLSDLLANKEQLTKVLLRHVVPGKIQACDIPQGKTEVETADGEKVTITREGNNISVESASVVIPDIMASNGVIHVIDAVI